MRIARRKISRLAYSVAGFALLAFASVPVALGQEAPPASYGTALADEIAKAEAGVKASPDDPAAHALLSQCYSMANRPLDALQAIEKALKLAPSDPAFLKARAELANWAGNPGKAANSYERLLTIEPESTNTLLLLARANTWNGNLDRAARNYRSFLRRDTNSPDIILDYIRVEGWRGNFAAALALLDDYEKRFGGGPQVDKLRARIMASAKKPRAAAHITAPLLRTAPDDYELRFTEAIALFYANKFDAANTNLAILDRLRPDNQEVRNLRDFIEAPQRAELTVGGRYYIDNDELQIIRETGSGGVQIRTGTRITAGVEYQQLDAPLNSGLEDTNGTRNASYSKAWLGIRHAVKPALELEGVAGYAEVNNKDAETFIYRLAIDNRPFDCLKWSLANERDYLLISPRSASMEIERDTWRLDVEWTPGLLYTVVGGARYDVYSDGNERTEAFVAPRRSVVRSGKINLDLGASGRYVGFQEDLNSGYYDPGTYEQYAGNVFCYLKFTQESGLGLIGSAGCYKDDTMSHYEFGWSADAEMTLGAFSDWMLKITGSAFEHFRAESSSSSFVAYAVSASITRRF